VGTRLRIWVKESDLTGGTPFLKPPWPKPFEVVAEPLLNTDPGARSRKLSRA
jgi:hypothetical protein